MPLGLLAKDSIKDLAALGRESCDDGISNHGLEAEPEKGAPSIAFSVNEDNAPGIVTGSHAHVPIAEKQIGVNEQKLFKAEDSDSSMPKRNTGMLPGYAYADPFSLYTDREYVRGTPYGLSTGPKNPNGLLQFLLPCLFPWATHQIAPQVHQLGPNETILTEENEQVVSGLEDKFARSPSATENDDISTGSDALGEKLSTRERQAVLARLRLAQPEAGDDNPECDSASPAQKKGLLTDMPQLEAPPLSSFPAGAQKKQSRGILKNHATKGQAENGKSQDERLSRIAPQRRSLFPQVSYDMANGSKSSCKKKVSFAPMARVVAVKSKNDMDTEEKSAIWWQRADYEDFRKTGRIITRAMMEGGSELWLNSERCTGKSSPNESGKREEQEDPGDSITVTGDKWWHKFGHSRRGLEHVVSMEEGKQRQVNVRSAIRAVIDEQNRQEMYNKKDPEKLRMVSLQYTSWARDLALASGSSDADAVRSSFSNERKTREFYLLKMSRATASTATAGGRLVPEFMQPALHGVQVPKATAHHLLDANTSAQIRYRRQSRLLQKRDAAKPTDTTSDSDPEQSEPVVDRGSGDNTMARRAAGFSADGTEKVDMAAVLSGMGAVTRSSQVVSTA